MRILLHTNQLSERGTTSAIFEYATYLKSKGFECTIAFAKHHSSNDFRMARVLSREFELFPYRYFWQVQKQYKSFDLGYFIKSGFDDGRIFRKIPSIVHAVFQEYEPHGTIYLYVSEWLAIHMKNMNRNSEHSINDGCQTLNCRNFDYLPHSVELPSNSKNLRNELSIKDDEIVGIRYGGYETFDIPWVQSFVQDSLKLYPNLRYVFANTKPFLNHEKIIYLDTLFSKNQKKEFLNTGTFFLHARLQGESFGLAILEAMSAGVPVFAHKNGYDLNHTFLVPGEMLYESAADLNRLISNSDFAKLGEIVAARSEQYSTPVVGKKLLNFISNALNA